jgi:membrane protein required for colicin V production
VEPLNNIDVVILVMVGLSMLVAFIRGFVKEMLSILGLALFLILTTLLLPILTPWMTQYIASKMMAQFVIFLLITAVFYAIWIICTDKLVAHIRTSTLSFMDRLFGLLFGFLRAVLILGFCFLVVKITLPEELKEGALKDSKYFMMSEAASDLIEKMLPDEFISDMVKSVSDLNKVEKKSEEKDDKSSEKTKEKKEDIKEQKEKLPSTLDQEQMDKMFELLVKPEVKNTSSSKPTTAKNNKGYDNKETKSLDRLIDLTTK